MALLGLGSISDAFKSTAYHAKTHQKNFIPLCLFLALRGKNEPYQQFPRIIDSQETTLSQRRTHIKLLL